MATPWGFKSPRPHEIPAMLAPSKSGANQEGTIRESVHAPKAERVGGHPSLLLTEYLTDTKIQGSRLVTKVLWTIAGPNVYLIDSALLNVQSPRPALSSLMPKLIARVRALR